MSDKKQVLKNLVVNIASLASRMLLGLWLAPYLVKHIGTAAYGFVPIAAVLTEYITIVTGSINQAISRYLVLDIQKEDWGAANRTFNTAFFSNFALFVLQIPLFGVLLLNLNHVFDIPPALLDDVFALCLFSMASFSISVFSSVFSTSMFAYNRLDLQRMMDLMGMVIRVSTIVILFTVDTPKLYYVGVGECIAACLLCIGSYVYWRKLTPKLSVSISAFDKTRLRSILSMSGWLLINYVGYLLFLKIDLFVVNRFVGAEEAGKYAAIQQWANVIRTAVSVLTVLTTPLVLTAYAKNDFERIKHVLSTSMKMLGALIAVVVGIMMVQSQSLLNIWIGNDIAAIYPLMILLIVHLSVNLPVIPLFTVFTAYNRVKVPGMVTLFSGLANLGLAILFTVYTDLGMYGVALASLIVLTAKNAVFTPLYAARVMELSWFTYLPPIGKAVLATGLVYLASMTLEFFVINSWLKLLVSSAIVGVVVLPIIWRTIFNKSDRQFIVRLFPGRLQSKMQWMI